MPGQTQAETAKANSPLGVFVASLASHSLTSHTSAQPPQPIADVPRGFTNLASWLAAAGSPPSDTITSECRWGDVADELLFPALIGNRASHGPGHGGRACSKSWCPLCQSSIEDVLLPGGVSRRSLAPRSSSRLGGSPSHSPSPRASPRLVTPSPVPTVRPATTTPTPTAPWWEQQSVSGRMSAPLVRWPTSPLPTPSVGTGGRVSSVSRDTPLPSSRDTPTPRKPRSPYARNSQASPNITRRIYVDSSTAAGRPESRRSKPSKTSASRAGSPRPGDWGTEPEIDVDSREVNQKLGPRAVLRSFTGEHTESKWTAIKRMAQYCGVDKTVPKERVSVHRPDVAIEQQAMKLSRQLSMLEEYQRDWRQKHVKSKELKRLKLKMMEDMERERLQEEEEERLAKLQEQEHKRHARNARLSFLVKQAFKGRKIISNSQKRMSQIVDMEEWELKEGGWSKRSSKEVESPEVGKPNAIDKLRDEKFAKESFERYDWIGTGFLNHKQIMAVLQDAGLNPKSAEEKHGVRKSFVNFLTDEDDDASESSDSSAGSDADKSNGERGYLQKINEKRHDSAKMLTAKQKQALKEKDAMVNSAKLKIDEVPDLLHRIRSRLRVLRAGQWYEHFEQYDKFDTGFIDFEGVNLAMNQLGVYPRALEDQADYMDWLRACFSTENTVPEIAAVAAAHDATGRRKSRFGVPAEPESEQMQVDLESRHFSYLDFELIAEHLNECKMRKASQEQLELAVKFGVKPGSKLFLEFRNELQSLREVFDHFDMDNSGFLDKTETWVALNVLGLLPHDYKDKLAFINLISYTCMEHHFEQMKEDAQRRSQECDLPPTFQATLNPMHKKSHVFQEAVFGRVLANSKDEDKTRKPSLVKLPSPKAKGRSSKRILTADLLAHQGRRSTLKASLNARGKARQFQTKRLEVAMTLFEFEKEDHSGRNAAQVDGKEGAVGLHQINFTGFLKILSIARAWLHQRMTHELVPVFERHARSRDVYDEAVMCLPDICRALEALNMQPKNKEEQALYQKLLDEKDKWGNKPQTIHFDDFVAFVRQAREWASAAARREEREYAMKEFALTAKICNEYRLAYDALDNTGVGLDITRVRKCFKLFGRSITSDQLRDIFNQLDENGDGVLNFTEFMQIVYELDQAEEAARKEAVKHAAKRRSTDNNNEEDTFQYSDRLAVMEIETGHESGGESSFGEDGFSESDKNDDDDAD